MGTKKIKQPVRNGKVKVPVVMQMEALECGAASLTMILAYYGKWIPLEQVRADCGVSRDGSNAKNILKAARSYGLAAKGYRYEPESLKENGKFPCIIHWNFNHFVVLDGFKGGKAYLNDPAKGSYSVPMEIFDKSFTGICLMFEPAKSFEPGGAPKSILAFAKKRLKEAKTAIVFVALTTLVTALLGIITPAFSRIFLDRLLTGENPEWFLPFIFALGGISVIQLIVEWIKAVYSLKINGQLSAVGSADYMWKVLRMPMEFFSQRMAGDIQQRQRMNASVAQSLVETFAPLALNTVMLALYFVVMLRYSPILTLVGVASIVINFVVSKIISNKRMNITRVQMRDAGKLAGAAVAGIEMVETIKASGAENGFFEKWAGYQASVNTQQVRFERLNQYLGMIPELVSSLANIAVLILGVYFTIDGKFTVGMIMAFQGFLGSFTEPAQTLISAGQTLQEMRTQMERVEDVMEYPTDVNCSRDGISEDAKYSKLSGSVELKNVTFGYSRLAEPLIRDFHLTLKTGSRVAFVGTSGCGKSTLSKLISGLYRPWEGEILFDGKHKNFFEIVESIYAHGMHLEDLNTNGSFLDETALEQFRKIGCNPLIKISFDGIGHHDWLRNRKGAETDALRAIRLCVEKGFRVKVQTNVHRLNIESMLPTAEMLDEMGVDEMRVIRTSESPRWKENAGGSCLEVEEYYESMLEFADRYVKKKHNMTIDIWQFLTVFPRTESYHLRPVEYIAGEYRDSMPVCRGNRGMVAVAADGNVYPCMQMSGYFSAKNNFLGNVKKEGLQPILQEGRYLSEVCATLGQLSENNETCAVCPYFKHCGGGCRALALAITGDKFGIDPAKCLFFQKGWHRKIKETFRGWKNLSPMEGE